MTDAPAPIGFEPVAPEKAGFDAGRLAEAVGYARAHESGMNRDIGLALASGHFSEPLPDGEIVGPTRPRGDPNGLVLRGARVAASWGPVDAPDMTFSVTKSYLALCAGLAWDDRLIPDLDAPARELVPDLFDAPQNRAVTWRHLLQQTSEWEGELWGKSDRIDRNRSLDTAPGAPSLKGTHRDLREPGGFWEYNDIRVNVLAYALMRVFGRPLPEVLAERVMRPIGASDRWEWHGYSTSWVEIGGRRVQSVSGGAHWGGGLFIPTTDHARIGLLMLNRGRWGDRQLLSEAWVEQCLSPCPLNPSYGFLWWLNGTGAYCPTAPRSSYFALGVGRNIIWVDPELDLVAVVRWIERDAFDGFAERVITALA
jgi:CubicO group peptidase (beta-lactamase class C family)